MPQYEYVARTRMGRSEKGAIEAPNPDEAVSILQTRDLVVVSIHATQAHPTQLGRGVRYHAKVKATDLITFARSLAAMMDAGLPLLKTLQTVADQTRSKQLHSAIQEIIGAIRGGSTFRDALAKHGTLFSPFWITLVETGEASGQLTKALEQIALHLEKSGAIQRKVVSAIIYPSILVVVSIAAILVFTLKIIPTFADMFKGFGAELQLPALTRGIIMVSDITRQYFLLGVGAVVLIWFFFSQYIRTKGGRWQFDKMRLQMPIFGPVFQGVSAQQFAENLGMLLKAGVPILHALEIVISTCENKVVASILEHMRTGVREGRPLAEPASQSDIFPPMVAQMLAVGEQTGKLPSMLDEIAHHYEEQVSTAVDRMTTLLEPVMLIGMGLVIGTLVIAMYLPIFQLSQVAIR